MLDNTLESLLTNEIIIEMASELPDDSSEWDTQFFSLHAEEEARYRGLDPMYSEEMIAQAIRELANRR